MVYRRCGRSGLRLPLISLGLWQNFGHQRPISESRRIPPRLRRGHHPFRPRQQLRAPLRFRRGDLREDPRLGAGPVPRRDHRLHEGRLRHVARAVRGVGVAQVPSGEPRPEPAPHGPRLCRHLLLPSFRSRNAARGDHGSPGPGGAPGQGPVRRHLLVLGGAHPPGGRDPGPDGDAGAHPPAVVLHPQPLDRGRPSRRPRGPRDRLHRLLAPRPGRAQRPLPGGCPRGVQGRPRRLPDHGDADAGDAGQGADPRQAGHRPRVSRWLRWPSPGCSATPG